MITPVLSVIVCSRDRPGLLGDCLTALSEQTDPDTEVIVVDDGSREDLRSQAPDLEETQVPVRWLRQQPSGLATARNLGALNAEGELLAFLDDDALVGPGWATAVQEGFASTRADALAGRIHLQFEDAVPRWLTAGLRSYLAELDLGDEPQWLDNGRTPYGANCAVTRSAFERVGGFPTHLGRKDQSLLSNEEIAFFQRLGNAGGQIAYWPAADAAHRIAANRLDPAYFRARVHAQGVSDALMDEVQRSRPAAIGREMIRLTRAAPILVKNVATGRGTLPAELWVRYCVGRLSVLGSHSTRAG